MPTYWFFLIFHNVAHLYSDHQTGPFLTTPLALWQTLRKPDQPGSLLWVGGGGVGVTWFVHTICVCYLCYPFLQVLIFGTGDMREVKKWWLLSIGVFAILVKTGELTFAFVTSDFSLMYGTEVLSMFDWVDWYTAPLLRLPDFVLGMLIPWLASQESSPRLSVFEVLLGMDWHPCTHLWPLTGPGPRGGGWWGVPGGGAPLCPHLTSPRGGGFERLHCLIRPLVANFGSKVSDGLQCLETSSWWRIS